MAEHFSPKEMGLHVGSGHGWTVLHNLKIYFELIVSM